MEDQPCPKCLLQLALTQTDTLRHTLNDIHATITTSPVGMLPKRKLTNGQIFGNYKIYNMLGSGGMGEVYDAQDLESGRRLALKVLCHKINSDDARKQFMREGRMAASVNHPNSVYVFGTTEIEERPVITMEVVLGGTLKDVVKKDGPLTPHKAVTAILQLIDGLEAAYEKGVLHRDIKPGNCFVDAQGDVKVGDYGLSISTLDKLKSEVTQPGTFMGTPAFASPEQLRGDDLDVRSDIYSVGVTLYFLLTGHAPFEGTKFISLMARVLEDAPPNLSAINPKIPVGLSQVVNKCLAKSPDQRFRTYAEFRDALMPFSVTSSKKPATMLRILAYATDFLGIAVINVAVSMVAHGKLDLSLNSPLMIGLGPIITFTYFALSEGLTGTTISKKQFGLRVVQQNDSSLSCTMRQALVRASLFILLPNIPYFILAVFNPSIFADPDAPALNIAALFSFACFASFFITMRRRNGMATLFDLISKTRVVRTHVEERRPRAQLNPNDMVSAMDGPQIGAYYVMSNLDTMENSQTAKGVQTLLGYDPQLFRKVWIRHYSSMPTDDSAKLRQITRFGRLRWLSGKRSEETNGSWDAFEAPTGQPFLTAVQKPMEWSQVRHLITDMTQELAIAETDGTTPEILGLDRLWITLDGRAKILDFRAPGLSDAHEEDAWKLSPINNVENVDKLINQIAVAALHGISSGDKKEFTLPRKPIPVHARTFLHDAAQMKSLSALHTAAQDLLNKPVDVSRKHKLNMARYFTAVTAIFMIFLITGAATAIGLNAQYPEAYPLYQTLDRIETNNDFSKFLSRTNNYTEMVDNLHNEANAYQIYGAHLISEMLKRDPEALDNPLLMALLNHHQSRLQDVKKRQANLTREEVNAAMLTLEQKGEAVPVPKKRFVELFPVIDQDKNIVAFFACLLVALFGTLIIFGALPCLVANVAFNRSPVMSLCGLILVGERGENPGRLRRSARTIIAWSPVITAVSILICMLAYSHYSFAWFSIACALLIVFFTVSMVSLVSKKRGLVDYMVGTWLTVK